MNELDQIKTLRKKLGMGQKDLAVKAGVSQSFIAKIESKNIEPTYSKAKRILDVLHEEEGKTESLAKELMHKKIIFSDPEESVSEVIKKMKKHGISQVPIGNKNQIVGIISDNTILNNFDENLAKKQVKQIMSEVPPIVSLDTPRKIIIELLRVFPLVLVGKQGEIKGIISKSDLLEKI
jgi:predicted transcriptional regulator